MLEEHTLETEAPEKYAPKLLLIDAEDGFDYAWTIGVYTSRGWIIEGNYDDFSVVEWYDLPDRHKPMTAAYHQITFDEYLKYKNG